MRALQQQLGEQLRFFFRNFPLTEIHPHALHAAFAAEAAAAQGKFWQMHDYIFHQQHTLEDSDLEQFAGAVGLDMHQFARDMAELWPPLPYEEWKDTYDTLHMWTQIVGKVRDEDFVHASYDPEYANRFWRILVQSDGAHPNAKRPIGSHAKPTRMK